MKIPIFAISSRRIVSDENKIYYKTFYSVGYTGYLEQFSKTSYEYTIHLGNLPLPLKDIETVRVTEHSVFEKLEEFKTYIVRRNMGDVIWPGEKPKQIDLSQANVFYKHTATSKNMDVVDVVVECDETLCKASIAITVNNLNGVNPNNFEEQLIAYLPVKFTVEFNGESDSCIARTSLDKEAGVLTGTGATDNPYLIESVEDLVALSNNVNNGNTYSGKNISLAITLDLNNSKSYVDATTKTYGDINGNGIIEELKTELTTGEGFKPIGNETKQFSGKLTGNLNCINNLYIKRPDTNYVGLIGYNNGGTINTLPMKDFNINGGDYTGGMAGYIYDGSIYESDLKGNVTGNNYTGLVTGYFKTYNNPNLTSLIVEGNVIGNNYVGGVVGYTYDSHYSSNKGYVRVIYKGGNVISTGANVGRISGGNGQYNGTYVEISSLALSSIPINGNPVTSTYPTGIHGADFNNLNDLNDINFVETALDTYIGGDNDGDGYYWDYNENGSVVRKKVSGHPLTFSLEGSGTAEDPYLINNYEDLRQASLKPKSSYKLTANIDLSGKKFYTLGSFNNNFRGVIDGNYKTISNLTLNSPRASYIGLIGYNNGGTIKDLITKKFNITGANYVSGLIGYNNGGNIKVLTVEDSNINGNNYAGGLAGYTNNGHFVNNNVKANVSGNNYVGIGAGYYNASSSSQMTSLIAEGNVSGANYVGGLIGYAYDSHASNTYIGHIRGIYKGGNLISTGTSIGRIVGGQGKYNYNYILISSLAMSSIPLNGNPVTSTYPTSIHGADFDNLNDLNDVNLVELALDTYIGGDNDGDGYYWDYDNNFKIVRKKVAEYPLTFTLVGNGTTEDPYLINNYEDLRQASLKPKSAYKLSSNIDLTGERFYMLGSFNNNFGGVIDGNYKTISNLTLNSPYASYIGLIGYNNGGTINDLTTKNFKITGANYISGLIGYNEGGNIKILTLEDFNITGNNYAGGLAGYTNNGHFVNNNIRGNVTGNNYVGTGAGYYNASSSSQMTSLIAEGNVSGANYVGGLIGYAYDSHASNNYVGHIRGIYKGGNLISTGTSIGRIVGGQGKYNYNYILISSLAMSSIPLNGNPVTSTYPTSIHGADFDNLNDLNDVNLVELALDTYIGGDNDGDGYYWDYDNNFKIIRKTVAEYPLTFTLVGNGTTEDPYLINNYEDLRQASLKPKSAYKLSSNIDLTGERFYMLGSFNNNFGGVIDGNYKTISNLTLNSPYASYIGLIGYNSGGTINDLTTKNFKITGANYISGLIGYNEGGNIKILSLEDFNINGNNYAGGLAGYTYNGHFVNNNVKGNVTGNNYVGIGAGYYNASTTSQITSLIAEGNVIGVNNVGGLVGYTYDSHASNSYIGHVRGIYKSGNLISTGTNIGRIVGGQGKYNYNYILISSLAISSIPLNGNPVESTYPTSIHGTDFDNLNELNDINLVELALDTYIGGDNDGDGYYWDYDNNFKIIRKTVAEYPLTFTLVGNGTTEDPYLINNYEDLRQASLKPKSSYKLTTDIDLNGKRFYMLGSFVNKFSGVIDGNFKRISNLTINSPRTSYVGLIGYNSGGTIKELSTKNLNIVGSNYIGGVTGYNDSGTIKALTMIDFNINGNNYISGLAGYAYNGNIIDNEVKGNITGVNYVGMGAGYYNASSSTRIASLIAEGNVSGINNVGGLVGYAYDSHASNTYIGYIKGVYKGGNIVSTGTSVGRIVGGLGRYNYNYVVVDSSSISSIEINGSPVTSTSAANRHGLDISSYELSNSSTYTDRGFNFTDETQEYIWYLDNGVAKFRKGNS